jgi:hypothetical protein
MKLHSRNYKLLAKEDHPKMQTTSSNSNKSSLKFSTMKNNPRFRQHEQTRDLYRD